MVYKLAYRLSSNQASAEDIMQETLLRAARSIRTFRADAKFKNWLYRITVNAANDWHKRSCRQARVEQEYLELQVDSDDSKKISQEILEALDKLPAKQRQAIVLTVYEGLNHSEAAKVLGCAEKTVSWRIFSGRKKLKQLLFCEDSDEA